MRKNIFMLSILVLVLTAGMTVLAEPIRDFGFINENKIVVEIEGRRHFIPGTHGWASIVTRQIIRYPNGLYNQGRIRNREKNLPCSKKDFRKPCLKFLIVRGQCSAS